MIKKGDLVKVRLSTGSIVYATYSHQSEGSKNHWVKYNGKFFESVGKTQALKFNTGNLLGRCRFIYDSNLIENRFKKMKKFTIKHRETGEYVSAFKDEQGCIVLANGHTADPYFWAEVDTCSWCNKINLKSLKLIAFKLFIICTFAFVIFAIGKSIGSKYEYKTEKEWIAACLQTASAQECKSQWFVMQRDKQ